MVRDPSSKIIVAVQLKPISSAPSPFTSTEATPVTLSLTIPLTTTVLLRRVEPAVGELILISGSVISTVTVYTSLAGPLQTPTTASTSTDNPSGKLAPVKVTLPPLIKALNGVRPPTVTTTVLPFGASLLTVTSYCSPLPGSPSLSSAAFKTAPSVGATICTVGGTKFTCAQPELPLRPLVNKVPSFQEAHRVVDPRVQVDTS